MKILGISSDFHDSSAALLVDGKPVFSAAEERFSLQKHDSSFPSLAIEAALKAARTTGPELDWIAYHEDPLMKFSRVLASRTQNFPKGFLDFARSMRELILGQMWVKLDIAKKLEISPGKIRYIPHHLSHAAYAFSSSPFESAAILVIDAVGEWSSTTWFRARRSPLGIEIEPMGAIPYPHSLGMLYSAFTGFLGFRVNDAECSMMALASFGKPRFVEKIGKLLRAQTDGTYEIDFSYFDFSQPERLPVSRKFLELFGKPRFFRDAIPYSCGMSQEDLRAVSPEAAYYADLASSVQYALEEAVGRLCAKIRTESGEKNLCLAGGVALNSTMNGNLMRKNIFESVHIPPDPGDGGGALGAAIYLQSRVGKLSMEGQISPYLGVSYDEKSALELLPDLKLAELGKHRSTPSELGAVSKISVQSFQPKDPALLTGICEDLSNGKIVGWLQGSFENGPRALGNRSILADPRNKNTSRRISRHVKARATFRPYACSLNSDQLQNVFSFESSVVPPGMRHMSSTHQVRERCMNQLTEVLHIDGSTRPQVLEETENPIFYRLLKNWGEASGCPALLNTSFNESGYPMISSPIEALLMFLRTDIETLVLNHSVIRKRF